MTTVCLRDIEVWINEERLSSLYTSTYWNNIEEEKKKEWWIEDGNYEKCLSYLKSSGLLAEYRESEKFIVDFGRSSLKAADLAAGIGWSSALLSRLPEISEVHAVEISKHRLDLLFKHSVQMLSGQSQKIHRYLGSFYDLHFPNESMDIVYLSQAFHHADRPAKLLAECNRVLKKDGRIILVGEHYIGALKVAKRFLSTLLKTGKCAHFSEMFPPDSVLGDHYYRRSDYYSMLGSLKLKVRHRRVGSDNAIYVADKKKV